MYQVGEFNELEILRFADHGAYLDGGDGTDILLPKRYVPQDKEVGDKVEVFVYHDSENRLIATTEAPKIIKGEIGYLTVVSTTHQGAFMDWSLMKDLFVPLSQQVEKMVKGGQYFVCAYQDAQTQRMAATQRYSHLINNENLSVEVKESVDLIVHRETDLGFEVIVNSKHYGLLHHEDAYRPITIGEKIKGSIKNIRPDNKMDVIMSVMGYARVSNEAEKILSLLEAAGGYLPFHDKSDPEEIYQTFGMSKKTFKMSIGQLYRNKQIQLTKSGIKLID